MFAIAVSIALLCAACVPFTVYDSPGFMGHVTDGNTGAPIPSSRLTITPLMRPDLMTTIISDMVGYYTVPEVTHRIWLPPLLWNPAYPDARIEVTADGYQTQQLDLFDLARGHPLPQSIPIELKHR
jgi:hypothetical protein